MTGWYLVTLVIAFAASAMLTPLIIRWARRSQVVDNPERAPDRKIHSQAIPLLGGAALIVSTVLTWWLLVAFGQLTSPDFPLKYIVGLSLAAVFILIGGWLDDRRHRSPGQQILWPILAVVTVVMAGIGVRFISNPFGGLLYLDQVQWTMFTWQDVPYHLTLWADLFTGLWLLGMMYTTKILDGLDGLVSGVGIIGSVIVFLLTLRPEVNQPAVGLIALSLAGAAAGFLIYNWSPAKIFLGESGSLYVGFILGVLSIISGGKIATALLIMGLPILDLAWVIIQRRWQDHASPFRTADKRHLHFRLLAAGLSVRQSVLILYGITILFGLSTLWFSRRAKVVVLLGVLVVLVALVWWVSRRMRRRQTVAPGEYS